MRFDYHMLYVEAEEHLGVCRSSLLIAKERLWWVGHVLWSEDSVLRKVLHFKWWCTGLRTPKVPILRHCQARHCWGKPDAVLEWTINCHGWQKFVAIQWWSLTTYTIWLSIYLFIIPDFIKNLMLFPDFHNQISNSLIHWVLLKKDTDVQTQLTITNCFYSLYLLN